MTFDSDRVAIMYITWIEPSPMSEECLLTASLRIVLVANPCHLGVSIIIICVPVGLNFDAIASFEAQRTSSSYSYSSSCSSSSSSPPTLRSTPPKAKSFSNKPPKCVAEKKNSCYWHITEWLRTTTYSIECHAYHSFNPKIETIADFGLP